MTLILASKSAARRMVLEGAGVPVTVEAAPVDEKALKAEFADLEPAELAVALAREKALAVSRLHPGAWVLGGDQTLGFNDGRVPRAQTLEEARIRLKSMRGRAHQLHSGVALARNGGIVWSGHESATLRMRLFSDEFLETYLAAEGEAIL